MKQGSFLLLFALLPSLTAAAARAEGAPSSGGAAQASSARDKGDHAIELLAGMRREITVDPDPESDKERLEVRFPIKLPDALPPGKITVRPLAATSGLRDATSFLRRVTGDVLTEGAPGASVLRLQLDLREPAKPGIYDLKLAIEAPSAEPWFTAVEIELPAARLDPPPKQVIEIVRGRRSPLPPLHLREVSGQSRISIQDITQAGALRSEDIELTAQLRFTPPRSRIRADGTLELTPSLDGKLPLGTSTGTVRIVAPELARPVDVAYEIRVRRSVGWICGIATLGLLIGWLLREVFARLIKLGETRLRADEMLTRLSAERRRRDDARFLSVVDERIEILTTRRWSNDEAAITAAITEAEAVLDRAIKDWTERRGQATTAYDGLKAIVEAKLHLPKELRARLAAAADPIEAAGRRLNAGDASGAAERLAAITGELEEAATTLGRAWKARLRGALADLAALPALASDASHGTTRQEVEAALKEASEKSAGLRERIERIDSLYQKVALLGVRIVAEIQTAAAAIRAVASDAREAPLAAALDDEMARLQKRRDEVADEPEEILSDIATTVHGRLRGALLGLVPASAPKDMAQDIEELVEKGDYLAATELVKGARALPPPDLEGTAQGEAFGTPGEESARLMPRAHALADALREALAAAAEPRAAGRLEVAIGPPPADGPPLAFMLRHPWFLPSVRAATAALVGAVVVFAAVASYDKPTFIGTPQELWSIFLWALGLNVIGASALTSMMTRVSGRW